jgi:CBS domain-containing protein
MDPSRKIKEGITRKYPIIDLDGSLRDAIEMMADNNVSALVVRSGEMVMGLVTISDVLFCLAQDSDIQATSIASFMTRCDIISEKGTRNPCAQLDEDQDVLSAIKVMHEAGVRHLVVSSGEGEPVGIVSSLELIKLLAG